MCNVWFGNIMFIKVFKSFFIFLEDLFFMCKFLNLCSLNINLVKISQGYLIIFHHLFSHFPCVLFK